MQQQAQNPASVARVLRKEFSRRKLTQERIAIETGMSQSQVSRILRGSFKRMGGNVTKLCNYASLTLNKTAKDPAKNEALMSALQTVWDGSDEHATALANLLKALAEAIRR